MMENNFHLIERNRFMFTLQLRDFIITSIEREKDKIWMQLFDGNLGVLMLFVWMASYLDILRYMKIVLDNLVFSMWQVWCQLGDGLEFNLLKNHPPPPKFFHTIFFKFFMMAKWHYLLSHSYADVTRSLWKIPKLILIWSNISQLWSILYCL